MMEMLPCPICQHSATRLRFTVRGLRILQCESCRHGFVAPLPSPQELAKLYSEPDEDSLLANGFARELAEIVDREGAVQLHFRDRLDALSARGLAPNSSILDFGCANGAFVRSMQLGGFRRVSGFDVNAKLVEEGRARWNLDLSSGDLKAFCAAHLSAFDAVVSTHVFEHLPEPLAIAREIRTALVPGGLLEISVPNFQSLQVVCSGMKSPIIDPPHHLHYFSPRSLQTMLTRAGFLVSSIATKFWAPESDLYLMKKGLPRWAAQAIRGAMGIPGIPIRFLGLGGVVHAVAVGQTSD